MNLTAIPASFVVPWAAARRGGSLRWLAWLSLVFLVGAVGLVAAPALAFVWAPLSGIAQGGMFALVMLLPLDLERTRERIAALVAMMLGFGYTIGATAPFVLGGVRDATGSFDAVLWACVAFLCVLCVAVRLLPRFRTQAGG
jgi:CP family cyanate transporter-like MFS transporter